MKYLFLLLVLAGCDAMESDKWTFFMKECSISCGYDGMKKAQPTYALCECYPPPERKKK